MKNKIVNNYIYDAHGNMLYMPGISQMEWDYLDRLQKTISGNVTSYYNYDSEGNRTRKVVEKQGGTKEIRYYINDYEVYRKEISNIVDTERITSHIRDNQKRFVLIDTLTIDNGNTLNTPTINIRYQFDNHLGSASLELDETGNIISYEEYHPFGTSSYRLGRNATEVQLKRYRYVGKERDEETGLYYYGARYYAAWLCRFISVDSLQFEYPYYTPYQYAGNKPISYIDLDGAEEAKPINLYIPNYSNSVDYSGGLGSQILMNEQNINNAKYQIQQKQTQTQGQTTSNNNSQTVNQRSTIPADQTASQATPLLITMEQLEKSLLTPKQLEIRQYIKENQWRNQGTISQGKSNYEKWLDVTIAPETANMVKFDPLFKATSAGGGILMGGLVVKELTVAAVGDAISLAPKAVETGFGLYQASQTPAGQAVIGAGLGLLNETVGEFITPDLMLPSPYMSISTNTIQILGKTIKGEMNQNQINQNQTNQNDTIKISIDIPLGKNQ